MEMKSRESSDPYYDLIGDYGLIVASFQSQYGVRLSREINTMKWDEFKDLLQGIAPETPLGRIVAIRAETDKEILKRFTPEQRKIRNEWIVRRSKIATPDDMADILNQLKSAFISMAGGGIH